MPTSELPGVPRYVRIFAASLAYLSLNPTLKVSLYLYCSNCSSHNFLAEPESACWLAEELLA